jgi:RHH-type rel operon transcriptional repressor/antitoxin RelB
MSTTISVQLLDKIANALAMVAAETKRSKSFHIQKAIEIYIDELADVEIALDRHKNNYDELISGDELRVELGLKNNE